jgi:hypothetical protein
MSYRLCVNVRIILNYNFITTKESNTIAKIASFLQVELCVKHIPEHTQRFVAYAELEFILCNIMDYSLLKMGIVFSGDTIAGNCFRGVCKISRE